jgi:hypothetical protein
MTLATTIVILGLLGIAIVWPLILAVWALPEARVASIVTFVLAALAVALLAADTWAPASLGPLSSGEWLGLDSAGSSLAIALAVLIVVAPMVAGFTAAYRAQSHGTDVPRWLIGSFLVPELMLVAGGGVIALEEGRFIAGLVAGSYAPRAPAASWSLVAQFIALPSAIAALIASGVTVWMLVTYDRGEVRG